MPSNYRNYRSYYSRGTRPGSGSWSRTRGNTNANFGGYGSARTWSPTQFSNVRRNIQQWIGSFRNINSQVTGAGKVTAFSPSTVNKWINYVHGGCFIYKFTNADFCRKFGSYFNRPSSSNAAARYLRQKFGSGIKDVTRGKGGCWLVAAMPNVNARPFSSYKW